ncbi:MAG TPA: hypothetical protein PKB13_10890 [Clostridia bacterium]|nr:hypothetical protein [Clostridia bacterium]
MIKTYQEQRALERAEPVNASFATIGTVYADGVSLIFDGETEPSVKHYKVNRMAVFRAGDRVRIAADSGTYVVEYPVGNPISASTIANLSTGASTATTVAKVNELLNALRAYKLIN